MRNRTMFLAEEMQRALDGQETHLSLASKLTAIQKSTGLLKPSAESLKGLGLAIWKVTLGDPEFRKLVPETQWVRMVELVGRELIGATVENTLRDAGEGFASELASKLASDLPMATAIQTVFSAFWVDVACPVIQMPHTFAAALMATDPPADLDEVHPPWPAMLIHVPGGMLTVLDPEADRRVEVRSLTVLHKWCEHRQRMEWGITTFTETAVSLYRTGVSIQELLDTKIQLPGDDNEFQLGLDTEDERVSALLYRLVINVCAAMENSENFKAPKGSASSPHREQKTPPDSRVFKLGKPLELDLRPKLKEYLAHGSKRRDGVPLSVQVLVRGHWKMQVHGKGRLERKRIWLQPFWRGPEDAEILVRPHRIKNAG